MLVFKVYRKCKKYGSTCTLSTKDYSYAKELSLDLKARRDFSHLEICTGFNTDAMRSITSVTDL